MIKTSFGRVDALAITGELSIPLVILKDEIDNEASCIGFIPGFSMRNINAKTIEECKSKLQVFLKEKLKKMIQEDEPFPFFPSKEQILKDFQNVQYIEFIKIKSEKRKQN